MKVSCYFLHLKLPLEIFLQHLVLGGIPLAVLSILAHDPAVSGGLNELTTNDVFALLYTSVFGSAISYGVYFYNATRGHLQSSF